MQNDIETGIYRVAAKLTAEAPREQDGSCVRLRDQLAWNPRSAYESFPNDRSLINPAAAQCLECYLCLQPDKTGE